MERRSLIEHRVQQLHRDCRIERRARGDHFIEAGLPLEDDERADALRAKHRDG